MQRKSLQILSVALFLVSQALLQGCTHKKNKSDPVSRSQLQSKRVALAEIKGSPESKKHAEVAIINEILDEGRFEIADRASVQDAMVTYPDESDWQRLGKKVGADYILAIRILDFEVKERQGYDKVVEEDSVLTEESGEKKAVMGTRYVKVKSHQGHVRLNFSLFDVAQNAVAYQGIGTADGSYNSRDKGMPGKMELLVKLTSQALHDFFEKMPK